MLHDLPLGKQQASWVTYHQMLALRRETEWQSVVLQATAKLRLLRLFRLVTRFQMLWIICAGNYGPANNAAPGAKRRALFKSVHPRRMLTEGNAYARQDRGGDSSR